MIIKPKVVEAMNAQIQSEFAASAQYVAIAVYFDEETLPDLAAFFYAQAEEERMHAMKFVHFILEAGAKPIIPGLPEMRNNFESASDAVQFALDQEINRSTICFPSPMLKKIMPAASSCTGLLQSRWKRSIR